ncbi:MAG: hypothetical protein ABIR19_10250, partial [Ginsengibacter sp.]
GILNYANENVEYGDAKIDGDKAIVPVKDKKSGEMTEFTMKREDNDWKVAFDKSSLMEMAQKKMKEHGMGPLRKGMHDSLPMMDSATLEKIESMRNRAIRQAQKITDSTKK